MRAKIIDVMPHAENIFCCPEFAYYPLNLININNQIYLIYCKSETPGMSQVVVHGVGGELHNLTDKESSDWKNAKVRP